MPLVVAVEYLEMKSNLGDIETTDLLNSFPHVQIIGL